MNQGVGMQRIVAYLRQGHLNQPLNLTESRQVVKSLQGRTCPTGLEIFLWLRRFDATSF